MPEFKLNIPDDVLSVLERLRSQGYPAYVVGGCVRDSLLGNSDINDWDVASAATPQELTRLFPDRQLYPTGLLHGTMTLMTEARSLEITSFRSESAYSDGRHPDAVQFSRSILEDLSRRDFTINAMAYAPALGLIDPYHGRADLHSQTLRTVGKAADRLQEDALRILRALRFAATLGLNIDPALQAQLHAQRLLLANISAERIQAELMRMLPGSDILPILLDYSDLFAVFIPEIEVTVGFDQKSHWHQYDVWQHTARALAAASTADPLVRLTLLFHDLGKPGTFSTDDEGRGHFYGHSELGEKIARERLCTLRFPADTIKTVAELIKYHLTALSPESMRRWLAKLGEEQLRRLLEVKRGDVASHASAIVDDRLLKLSRCEQAIDELIAADACFKRSDLMIDGDDLITLGMNPGPNMGQLLDYLFDAVLAETLVNDHEVLKAAAKEWLEAETEHANRAR